MYKYNYKKSNLFTILLVIIVALVMNINGLAAQEESDYKMNSIYTSFGTAIFINQFSFSYERTVSAEDILRLKIKANYGKYTSNGYDLDTGEKIIKNHKSISAVLLFGLFEANVGVAFTQYTRARGFDPIITFDPDEVINGKAIYFCSGIRYERDSFMVRVGFSNLELLYAGIGFNF